LQYLPAVWVWLDNVPWWFNNLEPHFYWANHILVHFGLYQRYLPDWVYVSFFLLADVLRVGLYGPGFHEMVQKPELIADS